MNLQFIEMCLRENWLQKYMHHTRHDLGGVKYMLILLEHQVLWCCLRSIEILRQMEYLKASIAKSTIDIKLSIIKLFLLFSPFLWTGLKTPSLWNQVHFAKFVLFFNIHSCKGIIFFQLNCIPVIFQSCCALCRQTDSKSHQNSVIRRCPMSQGKFRPKQIFDYFSTDIAFGTFPSPQLWRTQDMTLTCHDCKYDDFHSEAAKFAI
jgi:hypothetical protein